MLHSCQSRSRWVNDSWNFDKAKYADYRYCEIPAVAAAEYHVGLWERETTEPETYFFNLPDTYDSDEVNILAIGDSWFAYPKRGFFVDFWSRPRNLLSSMATLSNPSSNILSLSNGGEILTNMVGLAEQDSEEAVWRKQVRYSIPWVMARVLRRMKDSNYTRNRFDYILVSGGGNDLYPARLRRMIKHAPCQDQDAGGKNDSKNSTGRIPACVDKVETDRFLNRMETAYETLLNIIVREKGYEKIKIVTHTYDQIFPMPIGAEVLFPPFSVSVADYGWFFPILEELGINDREEQREITNYLLGRFQTMLVNLSQRSEYQERFIVVKTQGEIEKAFKRKNPTKRFPEEFPVEDYWLNEIHLTPKGSRCIAEVIHRRIRQDLIERDATLKLSPPNYECL